MSKTVDYTINLHDLVPPLTGRDDGYFDRMRADFEADGLTYNPYVHDERIMADGRPAHAWWAEITMLKQRLESKSDERTKALEDKLVEKFQLWKILEYHKWPEVHTGDLLIRIKRTEMYLDTAPLHMQHPENWVELVEPKEHPNV